MPARLQTHGDDVQVTGHEVTRSPSLVVGAEMGWLPVPRAGGGRGGRGNLVTHITACQF